MAGNKKIPAQLRTSFSFYKPAERNIMVDLYKETNVNSKTALLSLPLTNEAKRTKLTALEDRIDQLVELIHTDSLNNLSQLEQQRFEDLTNLIANLSEGSRGYLTRPVVTQRGRQFKLAALTELLELVEQEEKACALRKLHEDRERLLLNMNGLSKQRNKLPTQLSYYKEQLKRTNPASFRFLSVEQQERLKNQLLYTYFLLYSQYQLDVAEGRGYTLENHQELMDQCSKRIRELELRPARDGVVNFENDLEAEIDLFTKGLKFLGLTILAGWFVEKLTQFMNKKTVIKDWLSEINGKRLYWVWGGGLLAAALQLLPNDFFNTLEARQDLSLPSPVTGYMSWILYYLRFGINLGLLLKHTIDGPWMSEEESKIPVWERFKTQLDQRKFALMNDLFWAPANMICFFWLRGSGSLGYAGNIVTIVLLATDLALTIWRYWEERTQHEADMELMHRDREELTRKINEHDSQNSEAMNGEERAAWQKEQDNLLAQRKQLNKMEAKAKLDWKYKELGLCNDCVYAFSLLLAFCVVICFFCPPAFLAANTVLIFAVCGAAACFLATVVYSAINCHLERAKTLEQAEMTKDECSELLAAFQNETDPNLKKQLYLEIKGLMAETEYQQRLAKYQLAKAILSVLIDVVFPTVVFATLVFMPTGIGIAPMLAIIAGVIAISWFVNNIIMKNVEPKPQELPEFNDREYEDFEAACENPEVSLEDLSSFWEPQNRAMTPNRFFSHPEDHSREANIAHDQENGFEPI